MKPKPKPVPPYDTAQKDAYLGWKMTPNYAYSGPMLDLGGKPYEISLHYDGNGFKAFGDTASARPKVLFLGDSYTASIEVSNEDSFFNLLKDSLDIEVFAYGHAGFGTLQEYMVLDQWVDRIKPDLVVWEVCSNDFIDNYAPLEIACGYKVGERRPYLSEDGRIEYRYPFTFWQKMRKHLYVMAWLHTRWEVLQEKLFHQPKRVGEYYIANDQYDYPPYKGSVETTERIVAMIRQRLPSATRMAVFSADSYEPQMGEMHRIFESAGFDFEEGPIRAIDRAVLEQHLTVRSFDNCHFNPKGHQIIARALVPVLQKLLDARNEQG